MGNIRVHVCSRLPGQEQVDEAFRQLGGALYSQPPVLMGDLSNSNTYWEGKRAGHKQCRRFLECVDGVFKKLSEVIVELTRREALLDLTLAGKEGLVSNVAMRWSSSGS